MRGTTATLHTPAAAERTAAAAAGSAQPREQGSNMDACSSKAGIAHSGVAAAAASPGSAAGAAAANTRTDNSSVGQQPDANEQQLADEASNSDSGDDDLESEDYDEPETDQEVLAMLLEQMQELHVAEAAAAAPQPTTLEAGQGLLLPSFDLAGVAALIASGKVRRIICMVGAGISVSAGIPDFRTPGTGLYSQLERFNLPRPEAVFSMDFFRAQPEPFFMLAKELFPGTYMPTPTHFFMKLLHDKGMLLRCYSQNIDSLECQAGLPPELVVAAHGNFDGAHCIDCRKAHSTQHVEQAILEGRVCHCNSCGGLVKPDIVFFGESLPARFFCQQQKDFPSCDLLLVMGTSLVVQPFAGLIDRVPPTTPRVLLNRERVGESHEAGLLERLMGLATGGRSRGFDFRGDPGCRDVCILGNADDSVRELANLLGWREELEGLTASAHSEARISKGRTASSKGDADEATSAAAHSEADSNKGRPASSKGGTDESGTRSGQGEGKAEGSSSAAGTNGASSSDAVQAGDSTGAVEAADKAAAAAAAAAQAVNADALPPPGSAL